MMIPNAIEYENTFLTDETATYLRFCDLHRFGHFLHVIIHAIYSCIDIESAQICASVFIG